MSVLNELYKQYISLLDEEIKELYPYAEKEGWKSSRIEAGKELRELIREAEEVVWVKKEVDIFDDIFKTFCMK